MDSGEDLYRHSLPVIFARGTHYEVGRQIGWVMRNNIKYHFSNNANLHNRYLPFVKTKRGDDIFNCIQSSCQQTFPQYMDEIRGVADGAGMEFKEIFILNILTELEFILRTEEKYKWQEPSKEIISHPTKGPDGNYDCYSKVKHVTEGCTSIIFNYSSSVFISHTEDSPLELQDHGYIAVLDVIGSKENVYKTEKITGYVLPGIFPSTTFGFNMHGVVYAMNHVEPVCMASTNLLLPRRFVLRAALTGTSIENVIEILESYHCMSSGMSINIGQKIDTPNGPIYDVFNLEVYGDNDGKTRVIKTPAMPNTTLCHTNQYLYNQKDFQQYPDQSSEDRLERVYQLAGKNRPQTITDIERIMSDRENKQFPIYRDGAQPDYLKTGAMAIFDLVEGNMYVYRGVPFENPPVVTFNIGKYGTIC